jgi:hypothetical protein
MGSKAEVSGAPPASRGTEDEVQRKHEHDDMDAEHEADDLGDAKPRKKRRIIKTSDKKYECPEKDCNKMYSRAEHLYRHQLNRMSQYLRLQSMQWRVLVAKACAMADDGLCRQAKADLSLRLPWLREELRSRRSLRKAQGTPHRQGLTSAAQGRLHEQSAC